MQDIAVLNDVLLAFQPKRPHFFGFGHPTGRDQVIVANDLGANKTLGQIGVNCIGRFDSWRAFAYRPRANFVLADCKKAL